MKGGIGNLLKQAQKVQEGMQKAQEELASLQVNGESGGGMVKVVMNGRHQVNRISIDDSLFGDDRDMLEDLIVAAVNDAVQKVEKESQERMSSVTSGIPLPPGMKLPF